MLHRIMLGGHCALVLGVLGMIIPAHAKLPSSVAAPILKADCSKALQSLDTLISASIQGKTLEDIMKDNQLMTLISAAEIIRITGEKSLSELISSDKKYATFLSVFLDDLSWMQLYLQAGLIPHGDAVSLRVLGDIWLAHGKDVDFNKYLSLATGTAAAWGAGGFAAKLQRAEKDKTAGNVCNPVWRYQFFRDAHKAGKLHKNFINLKPWEIRFVSGGVWDDASLKYTQDKINLPPRRYGDACWRAAYSGTSEFGESIQGPLFYVPWGETTGAAQKTIEHGGVCGALSHVGHTAAAARGIPSYPVGQPGHCAYGFRPKRGQWLGGFGGPDGGPHNAIFPGNAPTCMRLMEAAFQSNSKVAQGYRYATVASVLSSIKETKLAQEAWTQALATLPHNLFLQLEYQKFAKDNNLLNAEQLYAYAQGIIKKYDTHGFAAMQVLKDIMPQLMESLSDEKKLVLFAAWQKSLARTPSSWAEDITPILAEQNQQLSSSAASQKYLENLLNAHISFGDGSSFGKVLEWGINEFVNSGKSEAFSKAFDLAVAKGSNQGAANADHDKKMRDAYAKAIIAAENARSLSAVRAIDNAAKAYQGKKHNSPSESELQLPSGKLVSDKGYLRLSTTSSWDSPCDHLNVLSLGGGAFHTDNEDNPYVIVELPKAVDVSGILVVKNHGNEGRAKKMKISKSTDGATWFEIAGTDNMPKQWKTEFKEKMPAKWIKVESLPEEKTPLHLSRILIFGK